MMKKTIIPIISAGILGFIFTWFYMIYWLDDLAMVLGYLLSFSLIPGIVYLFLILFVLVLLPKIRKNLLKTSWLWLIIGLILSYGPILYYVIGMTFFVEI